MILSVMRARYVLRSKLTLNQSAIARGGKMQWSGWIYFGFTVAMFVAFIVAVRYCYNPKRKTKIEEPKFRMLDDEEEGRRGRG